jgi:acyl-homoserine lactone acylase PvdQ
MQEAVQLLVAWDMRSDASSVPTTLAIEWAQRLLPAIQQTAMPAGGSDGFVERTLAFAESASPEDLLEPLHATIIDLGTRFPGWKVPWGEINRYQRISGKLNETYSDSMPSIPVHFAAATWGALPSYVSMPMKGTKKRYGVSGNSFICAVEFGDKVKAKSLLAGGNSNNPASKHFGDQASMYANGKFKDVLFYKEDVMKHATRKYVPGK